MKKTKLIIALLVLLFFLCSCGQEIQNDLSPATLGRKMQFESTYFPIQTYSVYEVYNGNAQSDFDCALEANPLDTDLRQALQTTDLSGTREQQIFWNRYLVLWQEELEHSTANLKQYLTVAQCKEFEAAQADWQQNMEANATFDRGLIEENSVGLGTQYVASALISTIDSYRSRVFHIKYMTMLLEEYVEEPVPADEQLWNTWEITNP